MGWVDEVVEAVRAWPDFADKAGVALEQRSKIAAAFSLRAFGG